MMTSAEVRSGNAYIRRIATPKNTESPPRTLVRAGFRVCPGFVASAAGRAYRDASSSYLAILSGGVLGCGLHPGMSNMRTKLVWI